MKALIYVFLGGGAGSIFRFMISNYAHKLPMAGSFPIGTLLANVLGCFCIGIFSSLFKENEYLKYLLVTGFCGGFTTFSTFSLETYNLIEKGNTGIALGYAILSVVLSVIGVFAGRGIVKMI